MGFGDLGLLARLEYWLKILKAELESLFDQGNRTQSVAAAETAPDTVESCSGATASGSDVSDRA